MAWKDLEKSEGDSVSLAEIGQRVAALEKRYDEHGKLDPWSHATVSGWKSGTRPEARTIRVLATVLGCDPEWLMSGRGEEGGGTVARRAAGDRRR
jgi:transcriptional regulator with XRE-family HTH domain